MKLSIIIPVYRVENTLDNCIESVLRQDFADWEMLLIDDGSPDSCPGKCDEWARREQRITALHKPNGGLSDARNHGLLHARGEYITFIDSDDALADGTLAPLMQKLCADDSIDIIEYPVHVHEGHASSYMLTLPNRIWPSARRYWHGTSAWEHCYAWNKIYRRRIFDRTRFAKGRIFEDVWIWPEILSHNPTVMTCGEGLYLYKWNEHGITVNAGKRELWQLFCSQLRAALLMRTTPFTSNGRMLYRSMLCRLYDIMRFSIGIN